MVLRQRTPSAHGHSTVFRDEWDTAASSGGTPARPGAFTLGAAFADVPGEEGRGLGGRSAGNAVVGVGVGALGLEFWPPRQPEELFFVGL